MGMEFQFCKNGVMKMTGGNECTLEKNCNHNEYAILNPDFLMRERETHIENITSCGSC
jgi:hypothetical protein